MEALFAKLLSMSVTAGWLILAVLLLRLLLLPSLSMFAEADDGFSSVTVSVLPE